MSLVWDWALPAAEKLVALKIADCANDEGRNAWPSVATIATCCGLTRRGCQKVLRKLEERGCIEAEPDQVGRRGTVVYRVRLDAVVDNEPPTDAGDGGANDVRGGEPGSQGGRTTFAGGANDVRGGGERRSPDPSLNHPGSVLEHTQRARATDEPRRPHPLDEPQTPDVVLPPASLVLFDELWALYPNKNARLPAMRAWLALNPSGEQGRLIVEHVRTRVKLGWAREPMRFIPFLAKFLQDRRWLDTAQTSAQARAAPPAPNGMSTWRTCRCGEVQEGRVTDGEAVYPPCPRCAQRASGAH